MLRLNTESKMQRSIVRRTASLNYIWQKQSPPSLPGPMGPSALRLFAHHLAQPQMRSPVKSRLSGSVYGTHLAAFPEGLQVRSSPYVLV